SFIDINGGPNTIFGTEPEANLDLQMVLGMAPLATILVYESDSLVDDATYFANYLAVVTQIATDNRADIVTDSWGITPNDDSGYMQFHDQHTLMTLQGITYLNASGDGGSDLEYNGLYPETDPDVLSVGGTVMRLDSSDHILGETGWLFSTGGYS